MAIACLAIETLESFYQGRGIREDSADRCFEIS